MSTEPNWDDETQQSFGISAADLVDEPAAEKTNFSNLAAKNALVAAKFATKSIAQGAVVVTRFAVTNSWGLRVISFAVAGSLLTLSILGLMEIVGKIEKGRPGSFYLFNGYMLLLAALIIVAECKEDWPLVKDLRAWVLEQFGFLQSNFGRGIYLVFVGIIWFSAWGWWWGLMGFASMAVGTLYITIHWKYPNVSNNAEPVKTTEDDDNSQGP